MYRLAAPRTYRQKPEEQNRSSGTFVRDWPGRVVLQMELTMSSANDYGEHYWCVSGDTGSVFVYADRIEITACGALTAWGGYRKEGARLTREQQLWAAAPGQWKTFFAASLVDGRPVAVEAAP